MKFRAQYRAWYACSAVTLRLRISTLLLLAAALCSCDRRHGLAALPSSGSEPAGPGLPSDAGNLLEAGLGYGETAPPLARDAATPEAGAADQLSGIEYVVLISVDGLAPRFVDKLLSMGELPTFRSLQRDGAWTHNARTDYTHTVTLPNHTCMLTGRPVSAVEGLPETTHHGHVQNTMPGPRDTLHNTGNGALAYVASAFDVVHDVGLKTCMYAGKDKFIIYQQSYDAEHGAPDRVGEDNGRNKIDVSRIAQYDTPTLMDALLDEFRARPCHFTFLHMVDPDPGGHQHAWGSEEWLQILRRVDGWIGALYNLVKTDERLRGRTALILTADHGGTGHSHGDAADPFNYTIPFYVVAPGLAGNRDLYSVVSGTRTDPGDTRPPYSAPEAPIRNGDAGNVALELLRLPPIPGSLMHGTNPPPTQSGD